MVSIVFDSEANALYIKFVEENKKIAKTILLQDGNYMDLSEDDQPIGLELILPNAPQETIKVLSNIQTIKC